MLGQLAIRHSQERFRRRVPSVIYLAAFVLTATNSFADELIPLSVDRSARETIVLTQGFSTTIRSDRAFGKITITNPDIVDLVLRTDKSAVLIPEHVGQTNVDFLDESGGVISSVNVIVNQQRVPDKVLIHDRSSLGAYSSYHCGPFGCEYFEEIPSKEQASGPIVTQERSIRAAPGQ
jgi:hypothetical protein